MGESGAFRWQSELPSGRNPFWVRDEGLSDYGLHAGDAVSVDTRAEPRSGDLVVAEAETEDGDSQRLARRYVVVGDRVRLEPAGGADAVLDLAADQLIVMGVIRGRVRFEQDGAQAIEEPLA
jgi:SOS-response transcriptional repressor LexA